MFYLPPLAYVAAVVCVKFCHRGGAGIHTLRGAKLSGPLTIPILTYILRFFILLLLLLFYFIFSFLFFSFQGKCPHRRPPTGGGSIYFLSFIFQFFIFLFFLHFILLRAYGKI